ncbi:MAG: hypothetical protein GOVbin1753_71 [Prokaryotic dsDNA virus sp.]|nr:MAG: hypothetical protein GOVbin1753_71 [Prokaryotic dsDNA virus sp.]|tara:strand:- start:9679 stop:10086 length:408 start_codon:yes stop_codon:yes gene_type:complete
MVMNKKEKSVELIKIKTMKHLRKENLSFNDMRNIQDIVKNISEVIYSDLSTEDKVHLIWDIDIIDNESKQFGQVFYRTTLSAIESLVSVTIHDELSNAKIIFYNNEVNKNEVSERSLGRESSERRSPDEASDSEE